MKILTVVGARPQFIKASPVSRALCAAGIDEVLVHTGQHYDVAMSQVFFDDLAIPAPARNLEVGSASHAVQTAEILIGMERAISDYRPDWVLVYGDTNSTLAGALAAAKMLVPIAHVEAGLRSFNRAMPEEINRVVTDHISDLLFAPTQDAVDHLRHEGVPDARIGLVGDVMYDVALAWRDVAAARSTVIADLGLTAGHYVLCTVHRAENTDVETRMRAIVEGLTRIAGETPIVMPVHPRTRKTLEALGLWQALSAVVRVIDPTGFFDTLQLTRHARVVVTDSGGLQKEAYFHQAPCVTLRDETEWTPLLVGGCNTLVPPVSAHAVAEGILAVWSAARPNFDARPFGDGHAAEKIAAALGAAESAR